MKVYVVSSIDANRSTSICGVFTSPEKAQAEIDAHIENDTCDYFIDEYEIDAAAKL